MLLVVSLLLSFLVAFASTYERCRKLERDIRKAHFYYFGIDFPWHYAVAQAEKESNCVHNVLSKDGIGSEGFAQITYAWWKDRLAKEGIHEIKTISNHARAQAYINWTEYNQTRCKKLFEMFQRYNGGPWVTKELQKANSCKWEDGKRACTRGTVCVWKTPNGCRQWRSACEINYEYSLKIYQLGQKYKVVEDSPKFPYW